MNKYSEINWFPWLFGAATTIAVGAALVGGLELFVPVWLIGVAISGACALRLDRYSRQALFKRKNAQIRDDYVRLAQIDHADGKDVYLFLRPLIIAGCIAVRCDTHGNLKIFEEILADAVDENDKRFVACVGAAGEQWATGQIHFEKCWEKNIIPLFKSAVVIVSMPGCTPGCIQESHLIRQTPDLLRKTLFVIPPTSCYHPLPSGNRLDEGLSEFYRRVVDLHREQIGLHLPDPEPNVGYFLNMDYDTGRVRQTRRWKSIEVRTTSRATGNIWTTEKFPSLDEEHIRAAIHMTIRNRGL